MVRVESYSTGTGSEVLMSQSWVSAALVRPADNHVSPRSCQSNLTNARSDPSSRSRTSAKPSDS